MSKGLHNFKKYVSEHNYQENIDYSLGVSEKPIFLGNKMNDYKVYRKEAYIFYNKMLEIGEREGIHYNWMDKRTHKIDKRMLSKYPFIKSFYKHKENIKIG